MTDPDIPKIPRPLWLKILIVVLCLPLVGLPALIARCPQDGTVENLLWAYPFFVLLSAYLQWVCWPERKTVMWIMMALTVLDHAGVWALVYSL